MPLPSGKEHILVLRTQGHTCGLPQIPEKLTTSDYLGLAISVIGQILNHVTKYPTPLVYETDFKTPQLMKPYQIPIKPTRFL